MRQILIRLKTKSIIIQIK